MHLIFYFLIQEVSMCGKLQQIICYPACTIDKVTLILLLPLERLFKIFMSVKSLIKHGFGQSLSATPTKRLGKMHWLEVHKNHVHWLIYSHFNTIIIGDTMIAYSLSHYSNISEMLFKESSNLGIGSDHN